MKNKVTRFILTAVVAFVLAFAYSLSVKFQILLGPLPRIAPEWWLPNSEKIFRLLTWVHIDTAFGLILVSIPFALGIAYLANRIAFRIALYVIIPHFLLGPILYVPLSWDAPLTVNYITWGADVAKQLVCLPMLSFWFAAAMRKFQAPDKPDVLV